MEEAEEVIKASHKVEEEEDNTQVVSSSTVVDNSSMVADEANSTVAAEEVVDTSKAIIQEEEAEVAIIRKINIKVDFKEAKIVEEEDIAEEAIKTVDMEEVEVKVINMSNKIRMGGAEEEDSHKSSMRMDGAMIWLMKALINHNMILKSLLSNRLLNKTLVSLV